MTPKHPDDKSQANPLAEKLRQQMMGNSVASPAPGRGAGGQPQRASRAAAAPGRHGGYDNRPGSGGGRPQHSPGGSEAATHDEPFPYGFIPRKIATCADVAGRGHDVLTEKRLDVAFEVCWTNVSPAALNPCNADVPDIPEFSGAKDELKGASLRWFMPGNRLAISPFTVKSAVAGVYASLRGGCYRVNTKKESPKDGVKQGHYPYTGMWKRYRVDRNCSKPGLLVSKTQMESGDWQVVVQPIEEYYATKETVAKANVHLVPGDSYFYDLNQQENKDRTYKPKVIDNIRPANGKSGQTALYHGAYTFGMNGFLKSPDLDKRHAYRFYQPKGSPITGVMPAEYFETVEKVKKKISLGRYNSGPKTNLRRDLTGKPWFDDLTELAVQTGQAPGACVYYECLGQVDGKPHLVGIGKSFGFRAFFKHEQAVPKGQEACSKVSCLCPRCALFGMAEDSKKIEKPESVGFKSRFKSQALVNDLVLSEKPTLLPVYLSEHRMPKANLLRHYHQDDVVTQQILMPNQGPPKPNRRDVGGYFDANGQIRGAKAYTHATKGMDGKTGLHGLEQVIRGAVKNSNFKTKDAAASEPLSTMRRFAQVCRPNLNFTGTLGAENADLDEAAALLTILDTRLGKHGLKLGLGKALGMGSFELRVTRIWVRDPVTYAWRSSDILTAESSAEAILQAAEALVPGLSKQSKYYASSMPSQFRVADATKKRTRFPQAGKDYWRESGIKVSIGQGVNYQQQKRPYSR